MESLTLNKYYNYICPIPDFLYKYLELDIFVRLKNISYFCGMNYASKEIYDFKYDISRYEHSISTALLTYKFTHDKTQTLAALFHDISSPCFSHVIDFMNKDYLTQESTEYKQSEILGVSKLLKKYLKEDNILLENIINYKKYPIVDNDRPKLCVDRIDGVLLPSISWLKNIDIDDTKQFIDNLKVYENEYDEPEIGFQDYDIASSFTDLSDEYNEATQSYYDNYMMMLLSEITKYTINNKLITYNELYYLNEKQLFNLYDSYALKDHSFNNLLNKFYMVKRMDIPKNYNLKVKNRVLDPLVDGIRLSRY